MDAREALWHRLESHKCFGCGEKGVKPAAAIDELKNLTRAPLITSADGINERIVSSVAADYPAKEKHIHTSSW